MKYNIGYLTLILCSRLLSVFQLLAQYRDPFIELAIAYTVDVELIFKFFLHALAISVAFLMFQKSTISLLCFFLLFLQAFYLGTQLFAFLDESLYIQLRLFQKAASLIIFLFSPLQAICLGL